MIGRMGFLLFFYIDTYTEAGRSLTTQLLWMQS